MDQRVELLLHLFAAHLCAEPHRDIALPETLCNRLFNADERTAHDKENVFRIHLDRRCLGMLALSACRELDHAALEHLEQRLLHALMPGVGGDGVVRTGLARDLVELVEVDDAVLRLLHVLVRRIVEIADGDLHICADKARLCEA